MRVQGPGTNEFKQSYWSKALNWSQGLSTRVEDQNSGKLRLNLHGTCVGGKINWFLENILDLGPSSKVGLI